MYQDYLDKTPSIIPRKSEKIESRKGVAVYFPGISPCLMDSPTTHE